MTYTINQIDKINEGVIEYLSESDGFDYRNPVSVIMEIKEKLFNETEEMKPIFGDKTKTRLQEAEEFVDSMPLDDLCRPITSDEAAKKLWNCELARRNELRKMKQEFMKTSFSEASGFFNKIAYREASYRKINREISKINATAATYDGTVINDCLDTLQETYGFDEFSLEVILKFFCQVRLRASMLYKDGKCDIRNYRQPQDYGIMPAFYSMKQGTGKSTLARIIGEVITGGRCSEHGPDEIMGAFGTLDVFSKPVILLNEMGKTNKDGTDELKKYINGEVVTVNQKYKDPVSENCFASFILTSNVDPMALNGQDTGSRRICIVYFNNDKPTKSENEVRDCIGKLWNACTLDALEKTYNITGEQLAMQNLKDQERDSVVDFLISLDDEETEFLLTGTRLTVQKACNYFNNEKHRFISKTKMKGYLETEYFDKKEYGRVAFYNLSLKAQEELLEKLK